VSESRVYPCATRWFLLTPLDMKILDKTLGLSHDFGKHCSLFTAAEVLLAFAAKKTSESEGL